MKIGYACVIAGNPELSLKSCTLKNATPQKLEELTAYNLDILDKILEYNIRNGIQLFRISSDIVPFASKKDVTFPWKELMKEKLEQIGKKAKENHIRLSMHPGQYTVLNSPDADVVERAVLDLEYHTDFLDLCHMGSDCKIILHIGGAYGDKTAAKERFVENYKKLPQNIKNRLVIENDDKIYHVQDVLEIANQIGTPVIYDVFHHEINPPDKNKTVLEWLEMVGRTWQKNDGIPKIHYSQQLSSGKPGAHSETIYLSKFMSFYHEIQHYPVDIMLEVKDKNLSAVKCILATSEKGNIKNLEEEWGRYKYNVLEHSHPIYLQIRGLLKDKSTYPVMKFYELLECAMETPVTDGQLRNALQHVWGYFKNQVTEQEKKKFVQMMEELDSKIGQEEKVKRYLFRLLEKYPDSYLKNAYYFTKI